jgi:D-galactarolactone cycloisomerase
LDKRTQVKIASLELHALEYALPPARAYGMARGLNFRRGAALIKVTAESGVVGYGEAGGPVRPMRDYLAMAAPFFAGRSAFDFELVAAEIRNRFYHFGVQSHMTACLSGISIAIHDAIGKSLGVPVHDLIGGRGADAFACYATTGYFVADEAEDFEQQLDRARKSAFPAVKIKIGAGPASDLDRVQRARKILGDGVKLMVDINGNYTPDIALESIRRIAPHDIHWCEEPVPPTDTAGYAEVRSRSPIPIAAGESFYTVQDFRRVIEARGIDIVQPSVNSCGGIGEAKLIAQLAAKNNLRVSPSVWGSPVAIAASLHLATSLPVHPHTDHIPYPMMIEFDIGENLLRDELVVQPLQLKDGMLTVPSDPAIWITVPGELTGMKIFFKRCAISAGSRVGTSPSNTAEPQDRSTGSRPWQRNWSA